MRSTLALALITLALLAWLAAGNAAAQVPPTPTAAPLSTPTPDEEMVQLEKAKLKAELDPWSNFIERFILPALPAILAFIAAAGAWFRWNQDRDKYKEDRQADAQRREDEQFRFIVEQFSKDNAAKLSAAVVIQTFFREERLSRFRRQAVEILIGNLRVDQTEPVRKALMVALREGIFSLPPEGERLDLRGCNLKDAEWWPRGEGENAVGIPLKGALLSGEDTCLEKASLRGAQLQGALLWEANLQGAMFAEANLQGASLAGANLQGAHLEGADLQGAYLWGAQLQGAYLWRAQLQGANLWEAQLQGAYLWEAVFGTYFSEGKAGETNFSEAELDEVCIASLEKTNWPDAIWDDDVRKRLEARYGAPSEGATEPEAAAETPEEDEA